MKLGAKKSKGDVLIFLDGDGTDPPQYIPELIRKLDEYDLVLGSRVAKTSNKTPDYTGHIFYLTSFLSAAYLGTLWASKFPETLWQVSGQ
jgi:cellulose synthase/poly-beta-1,6-N-acetylglucosamine synthase-like glycosyltransferase